MIDRVCYVKNFRKIQEAFPLNNGSGQELRRLQDLLQQHIRALKASGEYNMETYLTSAIDLKLDESTKLRWTEHSSKCEKTPPCEELLEFLDIQARHNESVGHIAYDQCQRQHQRLHRRRGRRTYALHAKRRTIH